MNIKQKAIKRALESQKINDPNESYKKSRLQGIANKMAGLKIKTNPATTPKGNDTCPACLEAKRTGAPLPPLHSNCRCAIEKE